MIAVPLFTMPMTFRLRGLNHWSALLEARSIWLLALHNNTPITDHWQCHCQWQCHWQCHKNESKIATQSHQTPGRKFSESDIMFLMENTEPPHCQCWQKVWAIWCFAAMAHVLRCWIGLRIGVLMSCVSLDRVKQHNCSWCWGGHSCPSWAIEDSRYLPKAALLCCAPQTFVPAQCVDIGCPVCTLHDWQWQRWPWQCHDVKDRISMILIVQVANLTLCRFSSAFWGSTRSCNGSTTETHAHILGAFKVIDIKHEICHWQINFKELIFEDAQLGLMDMWHGKNLMHPHMMAILIYCGHIPSVLNSVWLGDPELHTNSKLNSEYWIIFYPHLSGLGI